MIKKSFTRLLQVTKPSGYQLPNTLSNLKKLNGYTPLYYFAKKTVEVPKMGDSVVEGTVLEIKKKVGEAVKVDEPVIILETDKVQVEVRATESGVVTKIFPQMQEVIGVGKPAFEIDTEGTATASSAPQKEAPKQTSAPQQQQQQQAPTQQAAPKKEEPKAAPKPESKPQVQQPVFTGERTEKREPMSKIRQIISKRLKDAQNTTAMLTTFQEVDMSAVMDARKEFGEEFQKKYGIKLGFMSFFLRAATIALQDQPIVNSVIADNAKEIISRNYIDISVAVSTPTGLLVPVIKNVDKLSFAGIEKTLLEVGERGRQGKITPDELVGGTFTVSNGGVFGSLMGTPIINTPQSAILGMHAVVNRPVVVKDQIVARPMMYLALTYDHRLLDGKEAVTFLKKIRTGVEDPRRMLLGL